ncbi:EscV/YscV/HrcV family type III secretion system export apparatus protein [Burkholderia cepacia]|uniref:EscV/YscV/HrcV family type III secretion system export apparatus protein n=1 Tax=Burkholderia cepacia TaxID=292 RepID=A0A2S8IV82_BURCE|nr:type III secretion system export apparatus subunit SctV [Burkholderia cepacia]PQP18687.1 EscV/YscV/HrcV family type III secretion system export apparatus protein [Burkholderia cepacia]HDR9505656.1 type III secretion system export apparatus subunit SctV [Burkholderia cepacia]
MFKNLKLPAGGEVGIAALVTAIVSLMILPLPPVVIDMLLSVNICISVVLLMVTLYVPSITQLSAFPSVLLFTTLYRLSLNIASTKSILLHADAGHIIESFGELVVGGNLVVGLVVFLIITTVQFIVIAKGSERVAEVGARFTLDALPGKQMSIDADLRANLLTPDEARRKRARLAVESQLYGGMDGAMKFVKGDAIAGLIITLVNMTAGIAVGVAYHDMTAGDAANRFSILSIGDAMVSQIPSLLIAVSAGVMITRVSDESAKQGSSLGEDMLRQLGGNARAMLFAAVLLLGFAMVPGFPWELFLLLSALLGVAGYRLARRGDGTSSAAPGKTVSALQRAGSKGDAPTILRHAPQFTSALGVRLAPDLADRLSATALNDAFEAQRMLLQEQVGLPFPGITMWTASDLAAGTFEILVLDVPSLTVTIPPGKVMVPGAAADPALAAQCEKAGAAGGQADSYWAPERQPPGGATVWRAEQVIANDTIALLRARAKLFVGIQETQWVLEQLGAEFPGLVAEVQKALPLQRVADVLRRLLEENIPIRNARSIMESLVNWGPKEKDMLLLTEYVRGDLSRYIAYSATGGAASLQAVLFTSDLEQHIRQSIKQTPTGNYLALSPDEVRTLAEQIGAYVGDVPHDEVALVTSMDIRRYVRRMVEAHLPWLRVYSYQELGDYVELRPLGRVTT